MKTNIRWFREKLVTADRKLKKPENQNGFYFGVVCVLVLFRYKKWFRWRSMKGHQHASSSMCSTSQIKSPAVPRRTLCWRRAEAVDESCGREPAAPAAAAAAPPPSAAARARLRPRRAEGARPNAWWCPVRPKKTIRWRHHGEKSVVKSSWERVRADGVTFTSLTTQFPYEVSFDAVEAATSSRNFPKK